jgi:thiol:disulfide interchange protein
MKHLFIMLCLGLFAVGGWAVTEAHADEHGNKMTEEAKETTEAMPHDHDHVHDHNQEHDHDHGHDHDAQDASSSAEIIAVLMYADWCGSCKILDPALEQAKTENNLMDQDVLFVRMDYSNDATTKQSEMLAQALGLGDIFEANDGKTGFIALVDAHEMQIISTLRKDSDAAAIANEITALLQ